jgi:hypothetical protein
MRARGRAWVSACVVRRRWGAGSRCGRGRDKEDTQNGGLGKESRGGRTENGPYLDKSHRRLLDEASGQGGGKGRIWGAGEGWEKKRRERRVYRDIGDLYHRIVQTQPRRGRVPRGLKRSGGRWGRGQALEEWLWRRGDVPWEGGGEATNNWPSDLFRECTWVLLGGWECRRSGGSPVLGER